MKHYSYESGEAGKQSKKCVPGNGKLPPFPGTREASLGYQVVIFLVPSRQFLDTTNAYFRIPLRTNFTESAGSVYKSHCPWRCVSPRREIETYSQRIYLLKWLNKNKKKGFGEVLLLPHQNCIFSSKVTAILLKRLILPIGGVALGRVCDQWGYSV